MYTFIYVIFNDPFSNHITYEINNLLKYINNIQIDHKFPTRFTHHIKIIKFKLNVSHIICVFFLNLFQQFLQRAL